MELAASAPRLRAQVAKLREACEEIAGLLSLGHVMGSYTHGICCPRCVAIDKARTALEETEVQP
jgi:hypothetical protein